MQSQMKQAGQYPISLNSGFNPISQQESSSFPNQSAIQNRPYQQQQYQSYCLYNSAIQNGAYYAQPNLNTYQQNQPFDQQSMKRSLSNYEKFQPDQYQKIKAQSRVKKGTNFNLKFQNSANTNKNPELTESQVDDQNQEDRKKRKCNRNLELMPADVDELVSELVQNQDIKKKLKKKKQKAVSQLNTISNVASINNLSNLNPNQINENSNNEQLEDIQILEQNQKAQHNDQTNTKSIDQLVDNIAQKRGQNFDKEKGQFTYSEWDFPLQLDFNNNDPSKNKDQKQTQSRQKMPQNQKRDNQNNGQPKECMTKANKEQKIYEQKSKQEKIASISQLDKLDQKIDQKQKIFKEDLDQKPDQEKYNDNNIQSENQDESDYMKMWRSLPKSQKERLTKKQIKRIDKPDILSEAIGVTVLEEKPKEKKIVIQNVDSLQKDNLKIEDKGLHQIKLKKKQQQSSSQQLSFGNYMNNQDSVNQSFSQLSQQLHDNQSITRTYIQSAGHKQNSNVRDYKLRASNFGPNLGRNNYISNNMMPQNNKQKQKPKKIVVEERNENNEIVRQIIEKAKHRKITALKKAIMRMRESKAKKEKINKQILKTKEDSKKKMNENCNNDEEFSSGYVTIDEALLPDDVQDLKREKSDLPNQTRKFPYKPIFGHLEQICQEVLFDLTKKDLESIPDPESKKIKLVVNIDDETQEKSYQLHPKKSVREYVDMIQNESLEIQVQNLIQKLKKLYFNRKVNPNKKGKLTRSVKKRYIVGIKEVAKHLDAENLKMVILAINIEKVEGDNGLDDYISHVVSQCRDFKIPLVYCFTRYKLGLITKFQGQMASAVGVFNFQGANDEFNTLVAKSKDQRREFYKQIAKNVSEYDVLLLRKENRFLDWQLFDQVKADPSTFYL
ncbi:UNKNOWN [Stylonychia lemnae]|uniref:Ribosomal protein eL8/eL30/eS12/Gadd45 domain-containing protein n=1 Tax=Stylonychia lemnae TaxID=5949 RepID=A0A077ZPF8_STYLE|nr:UNKNOWN [Stylonychia lemnae]|eukprot:CDW71319.1 UNKNOWN [Stylonychia lemnae]